MMMLAIRWLGALSLRFWYRIAGGGWREKAMVLTNDAISYDFFLLYENRGNYIIVCVHCRWLASGAHCALLTHIVCVFLRGPFVFAPCSIRRYWWAVTEPMWPVFRFGRFAASCVFMCFLIITYALIANWWGNLRLLWWAGCQVAIKCAVKMASKTACDIWGG